LETELIQTQIHTPSHMLNAKKNFKNEIFCFLLEWTRNEISKYPQTIRNENPPRIPDLSIIKEEEEEEEFYRQEMSME
jgi:hypothetical protein